MVEIKVIRNYRDLELVADKKVGDMIIVTDIRANKLIDLGLCEFVRDIPEVKIEKPIVKPIKKKTIKRKVAKKAKK